MNEGDLITMKEAAERLGVSHSKMWQLVRDGLLTTEVNPIDRREKLVRAADLETLKRSNGNRESVWPGSIGMLDDLGIQSTEVDEWLEANWRPC